MTFPRHYRAAWACVASRKTRATLPGGHLRAPRLRACRLRAGLPGVDGPAAAGVRQLCFGRTTVTLDRKLTNEANRIVVIRLHRR